MGHRLPDPPILVITDRASSAGPIEARAAALFRGGCRWLSLREKDLAPEARLDLLVRLVELARPFGAVIAVHDDVGAALACDVALHLPRSADAAAIHDSIGDRLLGQSCHDAAEIASAIAGGADYATLSPVFPSLSKPGYAPTVNLPALASSASIPVLALGGVTIERASGLAAAGFAGIATMGDAMTALDPEAWFRSLTRAWGA